MKITKIEKKKRLYLLELDDKETLYITEDTIVKYMLTKGMTISKEELTAIQSFAQFSYGKNLALYYISFKQRTEKEVRDYLFKHEIDPKIIPSILLNLKEDHWIDDIKLLESLAQQNFSSGDKGPYVLKQKWLQKGCDKSDIEVVLQELDFSDLAFKVAQKLHRKYQGKLPTKALKDKITQGLMTKGFDFTDSKLALENLSIENDNDNEQDLLYKELDKHYRKYSRKYDGYDLKQRLTQALARKGFDFDAIASALREYL